MTAVVPFAAGAVMGEVAGRPVPLRFGDVGDEYAALSAGAGIVDRSARGRMRLRGPRAAEVLTGLVTNDVVALVPGHGCYAAALTPKGKMIADLRIFAEDDGFLIDVPPRAWPGWSAMIAKFVNPRLARAEDVSAPLGALGVFGPRARFAVGGALDLDPGVLESLAPYAHVTGARAGARVVVARVPDLEREGYELFAPASAGPELWRALVDAGATPAGLEAFEIARVEAGRPEWGLDIDESTIPQEANFDELRAISYTKGCYTGQETVARVHFRGHVNRHLRGLRATTAAPLPTQAPLVAGDRPVGDVRSAVVSPRLGSIALAMVRREVPAGATVTVRWVGGETTADVAALPFAVP
jgi:folate-binding protein YgfZ